MFRNPQFKKTFDNFFAGSGPNRVFVYYQTQYKITDSGDIKEYGGHKEFFVTDGEKIKLKGKGCYFLRVNGEKAVSLNGTDDQQVLFGEVSEHSVKSLNHIINQVYKPVIQSMEKTEWGNCTDEQTKEFSQVFDAFSSELNQALKSMSNNINLEPYPSQYENEVKNIHNQKAPNQEMLEAFSTIFSEWTT